MSKKQALLFSAIALMLFATSCTEAFKHKMEVADKYLDEMQAKSVTCGTATETNNGVTKSMTTLAFTGCAEGINDLERERIANEVGRQFYSELKPEELAGETHLLISAQTTGDVKFEYTFPLEALKEAGEYQKLTDAMFEACIVQDTNSIRELKDGELMPDDQMYQIYDVLAYSDSLYAGDNPVKDFIGFRLTNGVEDPGLKLYSANYLYEGKEWQTLYTINLDRETKKVVYIWVKTDPK